MSFGSSRFRGCGEDGRYLGAETQHGAEYDYRQVAWLDAGPCAMARVPALLAAW